MHPKVTFICRYLSALNRVLSVRAWIFIRKSMYHIRLKGKGVVSKKNASVHGDQYVEIGIEVPKHLSSQARQKLREYAEAS